MKTHGRREYMCIPLYREIPYGERDMYGADGRWLWRGTAEGDLGSDRFACYSDRV